jgi:hypothetical protein
MPGFAGALCCGVVAMVGSLLGYFVYVITTLTAIMAVLIRLSGSSFDVRRYPGPAVEVVSGIRSGDDLPLIAATARATKTGSAKEITASRVAILAKPKREKNDQRRWVEQHQRTPSVFARLRNNHGEHSSRFALGYAEGSGYRPGLDGQR